VSNPNKKKGSFAQDVLTLGMGASLAQVITILVAPILTRLFSPEAFGLTALFTSMTGTIIAIACLRYEMAIMLPEKDSESTNLLAVSILFAIITSLVTLPIVVLGNDWIVKIFGEPGLSSYLWLLPIAILLGGIFTALNYWNSRTRNYRRLSIARVSSSTITALTQVLAGFAGFTTGGSLIAANVIGSGVSTAVLGGQIIKDNYSLFKSSIRPALMLEGIKRYRKFPLLDMWSTLLNTLSWQLPTFILGIYFSSTEVGYYAIGNRVLRLPMSIIGSAIAQVFYQRASEANHEGQLADVVEKVFQRLVMLGMFPLLVLSLIGEDLFVIVFGSSWQEAGIYTQILSLWTFFWFIASPMGTLFRVLEKQEFSLIVNIVIFGSRFLALGIGGMLGSARVSLGLFAITGILIYGYYNLAIVKAAGVPYRNVIRVLFHNFLLFLPNGVLILVLKYLSVQPYIILFVAIIILVTYYSILMIRDTDLQLIIFRRVIVRSNKIS
jgi:lipopolysaccharide exporter